MATESVVLRHGEKSAYCPQDTGNAPPPHPRVEIKDLVEIDLTPLSSRLFLAITTSAHTASSSLLWQPELTRSPQMRNSCGHHTGCYSGHCC